jgi:hypothetical protein
MIELKSCLQDAVNINCVKRGKLSHNEAAFLYKNDKTLGFSA